MNEIENWAIEYRITAKKYGRPMEVNELVRHLDGNPVNNHPDNLVIVSLASKARTTAQDGLQRTIAEKG